MTNLQRSFQYNGDLGQSPISQLLLKFKCPVFQYSMDPAATEPGHPVSRKITGYEWTEVMQDLSVNEYQAALAPANFLGKGPDAALMFYTYLLQFQPGSNHRIRISDLSATIPVYFWSAGNGVVHTQDIRVLYYVRKFHEIKKLADAILRYRGTDRLSMMATHPESDRMLEQLSNLLQANLFLLNQEVFEKISRSFREITGLGEEVLLAVIARVAELRNADPSGELRPIQPGMLQGLVPEAQMERTAELVTGHWRRLFDFPLQVPELKEQELEIAGTVELITEDGSAVAKKDFTAYGLTAEYRPEIPGGGAVLIYDWTKNTEPVVDNRVPFDFDESGSIRRFRLDGTVNVRVKDFNGAVVWEKEYTADDEELKEINVKLKLQRPFVLEPGGGTGPEGSTGAEGGDKKLRGQLLELTGNCPLEEATVVIQVKKEGDEIWKIAGAGVTDKGGYFSMSYPAGDFEAAQALVSVNPDSPVNIELRENMPGASLPEFIYLMLQGAECVAQEVEEDDDCGCHTVKKPKRLPDQADLIDSDEYTQDMGAGCMNLTTPNRTLREYGYQAVVHLTDPDVANYVLEKETDGDGNLKYKLTGGASTISRGLINLQNPIRWQDSPDSDANLSLYQAVSVATGHILHYKSVFKADGYSLGELLYSLPLAPGQKKQIVMFDSSHSLTGAESQVISQGESLSASLVNDREITDQLSGAIDEAMRGRSSASTSGISAGLGAAGSMGAFGASLGVSGGYANSNSSASQNSSRDISQFFGERLRQSIMQNASSYRQLNATVVTTVREGQQYGVTTEAVANHNHCHAVTMMYFEVLRHYAIYQELSHVEECVFVPLLMTNFTAENISKWKDVLAANLLPVPSSTYLQPVKFLLIGRQHPLLRAFDANERIRTNYANVEYPVGRFADERMNDINGQMRIRIHIPRPKTRFDRILSLPVIKKTITSRGDVDVAGTIGDNIKDAVVGAVVPCAAKGPSIKYETNSTEVLTRGAIFDMFMTLDANYENVPPAKCIRVNFDSVDVFELPFGLYFQGDLTPTPMDFFAGMDKEKELWTAYAKILGMSVRELFKYFNNNVVADWDRIFNEHIAPMIVEKLMEDSRFNFAPLGNLDITSMEKYHGGDRVMVYNVQGNSSLKRSAVDQLRVDYASPLSGSEKASFFNFVTFKLESITLNYTTDFSSGTLIRRSGTSNDLRDGVPNMSTPLNHEEKRNPRNEDKVLVRQLLEHLNSNLEHYNKLLWYRLDPDRRFMLLDGFSIQVYDDLGSPAGYRSLASVVKNQLITVTGNSLVFPVAAGYKVSPSYITAINPEDGGRVAVSLLDHYKPSRPVPPYRISVPTRGVYLEAIQGVCDSCERVKPNSSQDWNKFPVEEPTAIMPVTTPTPRITDWKAAFKDFAAPMINIQNAPEAPAPGAGLAGLSELLSKAGIFNDITGLQGNQQNAIRTYLSNQENVRAMAEMAKGLAMQQHNTENSQSITDSINQARQSGAITPAEESNLVRQHLQQQIDGGDRMREEARGQREQERPSLTEAAIEAVGQGRAVTAQRTDNDGNVESVEISEPASPEGGNAVNVSYEVFPLQQPSSLLCWATAATMMVNWRNRTSSTIPAVLRDAGRNLTPPDENLYVNMFTNNQGLQASQKDAFIQALNMMGEAPASYTVQQYILWLQTYGPLWITTDSSTAAGVFSPHARILTKIAGPSVEQTSTLMFTFNDPATGAEITQSFDAFLAAYEQMVTDNPGSLFIQIVHFRDPVPAGEGQAVTAPATRTWMGGVPTSGSGMTGVKQAMHTRAVAEYQHWHNAGSHTGTAWWETDNDPHVQNKLVTYWTSAYNTDAKGAATTQVSTADAQTKIANRDAWSAAFISCVVTSAGISDNAVFSHSIRHVDFIARSIWNKENTRYENPFWGYRIGDYAPQVGDIVGRGHGLTYANVFDRANRNVRRASSHTDIVTEVHADHIIVIGGNLELDGIRTTRTSAGWSNTLPPADIINVSVGKRKIYLDEHGKIDPTKTWEIFNNAAGTYESRVQYTGPQSEYFVVIKVRTDVNNP